MSEEDREKWNRRYREGAYSERPYPSGFLLAEESGIAQRLRTSDTGRLQALDVACGAGRNSIHLAASGYDVDAVDVSAEGLARARLRAGADAPIRWIEHDLDQGLPMALRHDYDLIIIMRYLDLDLVRAAANRLRPGGHLLCEVHLQSEAAVTGPGNQAFRAPPGALREAATELDVLSYWEGIARDPDGATVAVARLVAKSPGRKD